MFNPQQLIQMLMQRNPAIMNNPNAQNMLNVVTSNDVNKGEQIARNLCQSYGVPPEQVYQQAKKFFGIQ